MSKDNNIFAFIDNYRNQNQTHLYHLLCSHIAAYTPILIM